MKNIPENIFLTNKSPQLLIIGEILKYFIRIMQ